MKMKTLSKRAVLEILLEVATEAQHAFCDAMLALETAIGFDIDDLAQDFANVDIKELRRQNRRAA